MTFRTGRSGPFLGCTKYPDCNGTLPCDKKGNPLKVVKPDEIEQDCPECGAPMQVKFARGRSFLGCTKYPRCRGTAQIPEGIAVERPKAKTYETGIECDRCGSPMVVRTGRKGMFLACTGFPKCRNTRNLSKAEKASIETTGYLAEAEPDEESEKQSTKKSKKKTAKKKASKKKSAGRQAKTRED
jgi:DNA topoisomerase-1